MSLLRKGPKFTPTTNGKFLQTKVDLKDFSRKLIIKEIFNDIDNTDESLLRNPSKKTFYSNNDHLTKITKKIENIDTPIITPTKNITTTEREALNELKNNENIIIKKADKGGSLVIMDKEYYRDQLVLKCHLNNPKTYSIIEDKSDKTVIKNIKNLVDQHNDC